MKKILTILFFLGANCLYAQYFTDVSSSIGINASFGDEPFGYGGGISFVDFNNDGWDDLTLGTQSGDSILFYVNNAGQFQKIASLVNDTYHQKGMIWVDIDNDRDLDFAYNANGGQCKLYENAGNLNLNDISIAAGVPTFLAEGIMVNSSDMDKDGFLDLFYNIRLPNSAPSPLLINNGNNTFRNQTGPSGIDLTNASDQCSAFIDFDNDGDGDLYVGLDKAKGNRLYKNNGNLTFSEISNASGTGIKLASMNVSYGDIDNDGYLDMYITDTNIRDGNVLFHNNGDGTFSNISASAGVTFNSTCWGASFADFNNDGYQDLFVVSSINGVADHNKMYINNQDLTFTEINDSYLQTTSSNSYVTAIGDYNNDGKIDIAVSNGENQNVMLLRNNLAQGNYLQVSLEGTMSNRDAVGTWVELYTGNITQYRYTSAGISFSAQNSKKVHFGINNYNTIDSLIIRWPSGTINRHYNISVNQVLHLTEVAGDIDADFDGVISTLDCDDSNGNVYPNAPELCDGIDNNCDNIVDELCPGINGSIARQWNEILIQAIRNDLARPTVHARNLFHISTAMYDAWAAYDSIASPFFLGNTVENFSFPFDGIPFTPQDVEAARHEAISYAAYRLMTHRFKDSPGAFHTLAIINNKFTSLGYDPNMIKINYSTGHPGALGNYIASKIIEFGHQDNSREVTNYDNAHYQPVNPPLVTQHPGNPNIVDPNRWQPLTLDVFIDQSGNEIPNNTPPFLSPEWGNVTPFALTSDELSIHERNGRDYWVYHDPGAPPQIDASSSSDMYKWGFSLVSLWSSHLDPYDGVMWDISPRALGNIDTYPSNFADQPNFYKLIPGGDASIGHSVNPVTGQPYAPNMVPRGDYVRVLAEFWADGPDSETPPGHWFSILNYVSDHPLFIKKYRGQGPVLTDLEWDVKSYFMLGGAMHDAAISAWGMKGYYDYLRPISAIRYMADQGQSTDPNLPSYNPNGIPLISGYIELVQNGDPLAGIAGENLGKIKVFAWQGHDHINDPANDEAGVGWILAEDWMPYQRPSFVTPNFAGYVSGHSTFSRAAAEVMTLVTGDPYFPGGMGEFTAEKDNFLVFEKGPSTDVKLQWATYRDASDQTSLSRIWGGIHPPADDIPGRLAGIAIGINAFNLAEEYFFKNKMNCDGLHLNIPTISQNIYNAEISISSEAIVNDYFDIGFEAENYICLENGFEVKADADFYALIANCGTSPSFIIADESHAVSHALNLRLVESDEHYWFVFDNSTLRLSEIEILSEDNQPIDIIKHTPDNDNEYYSVPKSHLTDQIYYLEIKSTLHRIKLINKK